MKRYLIDIAAGLISGLLSLSMNDVASHSFIFGFSDIQSVLMWLIPALLLFFGYTRLPLYKTMHSSTGKEIIFSFGMSLVGLGIAYLIGFSLNYLAAALYVAAIWSM